MPSHAAPCCPMPPQGNPIHVRPMPPQGNPIHIRPMPPQGNPIHVRPMPPQGNPIQVCLKGIPSKMPLWRHGAALDGMPLQRTWMGCPGGGLGWNALVAALGGLECHPPQGNPIQVCLKGIPSKMPLWRHGAALDGMPLRRTWMGCPGGGLGWDSLVVEWGGLGWNALAADLDGMPWWRTWM